MASWFDYIALFVTVVLFAGFVYGMVAITSSISSGINNAKTQLKERGIHVSDKGVSVKTASRFNREDYIDATQRGFIKGMSAASFGTADNLEAKTPVLNRTTSSQSNGSAISASASGDSMDNGEKKKHRFGLKRRQSGQ